MFWSKKKEEAPKLPEPTMKQMFDYLVERMDRIETRMDWASQIITSYNDARITYDHHEQETLRIKEDELRRILQGHKQALTVLINGMKRVIEQ